MLYGGMLLQGITILLLLFADTFAQYIVLAIALGLGTALVYPTFLSTIAEFTHPMDRANSMGIFRFWRDLGYALGAVLTSLLADMPGMLVPVLVIGLLTLLSATVIMVRMPTTPSVIKKSNKEKHISV